MTTAGELAMWAALLIAAWGAVAGSALLARPGRPRAAGFTESARRALWAAAILLAVAVTGIAALLLAPDPSFTFAASAVSARMPAAYRLAAMVMRLRGDLLLLALFTALLGVLAARRAPTVERPPAASFDAQICAIVLVLTMLPLAAGADPYARAAGALTMAPASTPTWQTPYPPLARLALLLVTAVALVAAALTLSGRSARTWWLAAWGLGAPALVLSLRASLTGKPWGWAEWTAAAAWLALGVWLHRRRARAALSAHLVHAGAVVALAAFVGIMMRAEHQVVLETAESAELNDPLGSEWRFTSEGLSMYDELNRQAAVVLLSARHGGRVRHEPVELRQYVGDDGAPLGREARVAGFFPGTLVSTVVAFAGTPDKDSVTFAIRFVPFFMWWWAAALLMSAGAAAGIIRERSA
jgi:cytochrome c biogenesis factor